MKKIIRIFDGVLFAFLIVVYMIVGVGSACLPNQICTYTGKDIVYKSIYTIDIPNNTAVDYQGNTRVSSDDAQIKILGIIPVKNTKITQAEEKQVYVSGESFGIKLYTDGVIIVGIRDVETSQGKCNPAKQAGLEKGDVIVSINNKKMTSSSMVEEMFNDNNGKDYEIVVKRNGNYKHFTLSPVYSQSEGRYKVGVWVRDSTAGIGTITFFNPYNNSFAALGHPITDVDTNEIMPILNGEAVKTKVTKIYKSIDGEAGSLCCDFTNDKIAELSVNSKYGIYGKYNTLLSGDRIYTVANNQEVERGKAQLLCTVDNSGPQLYDVEISRISYRENNDEKNMIVKITDQRLINKTGGIIQGMSGSPIIQNGKLVGALTHVIVDNPKKGYAIFAETMLNKSLQIE